MGFGGASLFSADSWPQRQQKNDDPTAPVGVVEVVEDLEAEQIQVPVRRRNKLGLHERGKTSYGSAGGMFKKMEGNLKILFTTILVCFLFPSLFFIVYHPELNPVSLQLQLFVNPDASVMRQFGGFIGLRRGQGEEDGEMKTKRERTCDTSYERTNICRLSGDVRVHGNTSSVYFFDRSEQEETWRIKPYARKRDKVAMSNVRKVRLLRRRRPTDATPRCTDKHTVPAIIFSTAGYSLNFYHDFTDLLLPIFLTSRRHGREVRFIVTNMRPQWISKYKMVFHQLTNYPIIDLDNDDDNRVHCFKNATVGLVRYDEFGAKTPRAASEASPSMLDFAKLLKASFYLEITETPRGRRPRLLLIARRRTRRFRNVEEVRKVVEEVGFELVEMDPGTGSTTMKSLAQAVNSCQVLMGVHGAGLTNMLFLPANATVIQIVPWGGGLEQLAWYCFGSVAGELGVKYLEYRVGMEESSLVEMYPRDHPIFKDTRSIPDRGWNATFSTFMNQDVRVDVSKLRLVLLKALRTYLPSSTSSSIH